MFSKLTYKISFVWAPRVSYVEAESHYEALVAGAAIWDTTIDNIDATTASAEEAEAFNTQTLRHD